MLLEHPHPFPNRTHTSTAADHAQLHHHHLLLLLLLTIHMAAFLRVGTYPGEPNYEASAFVDPSGAPCRLVQLPVHLLKEVLGFVGGLRSFSALFQQTSKALAAFAEENESVWRCVDSVKIPCSRQHHLKAAWMPLLRRCAPCLRKVVVRQAGSLHNYPDSVPLRDLLLETPALRDLVFKPSPMEIRRLMNDYDSSYMDELLNEPLSLAALPAGDGVLPVLERLDIGDHSKCSLAGGKESWWPTLIKLRSLEVDVGTFVDHPWLGEAVGPLHGRLQRLVVGMGDMQHRSQCAQRSHGVFNALLGYDAASESFVGPPSALEHMDLGSLDLLPVHLRGISVPGVCVRG